MRPFSILLIHTQHAIQRIGTGVYRKHLRYAPLTMPTLAALVPADLPATIRVVDEMVEEVPLDATPDLVGLTAITSASTRAYELAAHFKARGATVVMGGIHASLLPDEALEHVDAVVRGLAERSWPRLLRDYCAGTLQRVYEESPADPPVTIAVPDRRQIKRERYIANNTVEMSRGCTKRCDFCVTHELHADYLTKDVDQTLAEIRSFRGPLSGKLITFLDPNVIGNVPFARRFFTALTRLRKWWVGCVSIDLLRHEGLLDLLVASGAKGFLIGFESLDQQALDSVNKSFSVTEEYLAAIELFHRRGVMVQGSFVFGFDSDTPETFDKTVDFIIRAKIELPQFTIFTPFPGTAAFRRLDAAGRILHRDWSLYNGHNVVFQPQQLTPQQLQDGVRAVWERTYSLPNIVRRLAGPPYLPKIPALLSNLNFRRFMRRVHAGR